MAARRARAKSLPARPANDTLKRVGIARRALPALIVVACGNTPIVSDSGTDALVPPPQDASKPDVVDASEACTPGQTRCSDSNLGVETCSDAGTWGAAIGCGAQTCLEGQCAPCTEGQSQCNGDDVQVCSEGMWVTSTTCSSTGQTCAIEYDAFDGSQPQDWTMNGSATYDANDSAAQLTDTNEGEAGSWVFNRPITVDDVTFQFDFYSGGGTGADGIAFMLQSDGATALGAYGGGLGVAGLDGFGVEMDEYDNDECLDASNDHIAIDSLATCGDGVPTSLVENDSPGITIADGNWHTVVVQVTNESFSVSADGTDQFGSYAVTGWSNGPWYFGFGGGTGGLANVHLVRNVKVTFTAPRCL